MYSEECPLLKDKPTKTNETIAFYLKRSKNFKIRCAKELNLSIEEISSLDMASYFSDIAQTLSQATVRLYKAMLYYYFENNQDDYTDEAIDIVKNVATKDSPKQTRRTSGLRGKSMSEKTFAAVIYALSLPEYRSKYAHFTSMWLQAGALTGLRPHEWQNAELIFIDGNLTLKIQNGKTTNNRSHGEYRHLDLSGMSDHEQRTIEQFLMMIKPYTYSDDDFKRIYTSCMQTLRVLNTRLEKGGYFTREQGFLTEKGSGVYFRANKGKRVQLYTGRHRFSSVMKKIAKITEIAAMMGHKTDRTATLHYGKTDRKAGKTRAPKPVAEEVAKVQRKYKGVVSPQQKTIQSPTNTVQPTISPTFKG